MKKLARFFLLILAIFLILPLKTTAETRFSEEEITIPENEAYQNLYLLSLKGFNLKAPISGDLFAFADSLFIDGQVGGSINGVAMKGKVIVNREIANSLRVIGREVGVYEKVGGDLVVIADTLYISKTSQIGGDVYFLGKTLNIDGKVMGTVKARTDELRLTGIIKGETRLYAPQKIFLGESAALENKLIYSAEEKLVDEDNPALKGGVEYIKEKETRLGGRIFKGAGLNLEALLSSGFWLELLSSLAFSLALYFLFRELLEEVSKKASKDYLGKTILGCALFLALPILSLLFFVSIIGYKIALFTLLAFFTLLFFTIGALPSVAGFILRKVIFKKETLDPLSILLGVLCLTILRFIPYFNFLILFLFSGLVFSVVITNLKQRLSK